MDMFPLPESPQEALEEKVGLDWEGARDTLAPPLGEDEGVTPERDGEPLLPMEGVVLPVGNSALLLGPGVTLPPPKGVALPATDTLAAPREGLPGGDALKSPLPEGGAMEAEAVVEAQGEELTLKEAEVDSVTLPDPLAAPLSLGDRVAPWERVALPPEPLGDWEELVDAVPPKGCVVPEGHCVPHPVCVPDTLGDREPLVDAVDKRCPVGVSSGDPVPGPGEGVLGEDSEGFPREREAWGEALPLKGGLGVKDPEGDMDRLKVGEKEPPKEGLG